MRPSSALLLDHGSIVYLLAFGGAEVTKGWLIGSTYTPVGHDVPDDVWLSVAAKTSYLRDRKLKSVVPCTRSRRLVLTAERSSDFSAEHFVADNVWHYDCYTCEAPYGYRDTTPLYRGVNRIVVPQRGFKSEYSVEPVDVDLLPLVPAARKLAAEVRLPTEVALSMDDIVWAHKRNYAEAARRYAEKVAGPK